jgi:hypothetical protein
LLGFVEGEGTFGYKHLIPYFQIAQHKKNLFVLKAIEAYLLKAAVRSTAALYQTNRTFLQDNQEFKFLYNLNKRTGIYSMTVVKVNVNFDYLVPFFESMSFFSRKRIDYNY